MGQTILVGDIPITVTRKRIKHVHLRVHPPHGRVTMSAPLTVRMRVVEEFAATRLTWIRRQQERLRGRAPVASQLFISGESHHLWGREYTLSVVEREGRHRVQLDDFVITMFVKPGSDTSRRAAVMDGWHRNILHEHLPPLIRTWEERLRVSLTGYSLRRMKTRWGTCNCRTCHIRLNTDLVTRPPNLLEYVVVHELVHLIVPNHGARFVALMNEHFPAWREARSELNDSVLAPA
jgi:predicted metal-dependent hydrolase